MGGPLLTQEHQCSSTTFLLKENSRIVASSSSDRYRRLAIGLSPAAAGSQRKDKKPPPSSVPVPSAQLEEWQTQFFKTKFCPYGVSCSNGDNCRFAHSIAEVRPLPDLHRTKLCESYVKKEPCRYADCSFAHDPSELRTSSHSFYKVTLCNFYKKGKCWNGTHCRFAHGVGELQVFPPTSALLEQQQQQPFVPLSLRPPLLSVSGVQEIDKIGPLGNREDSSRNREPSHSPCRNSQLFQQNNHCRKVEREKEASNRAIPVGCLDQSFREEQSTIPNTDFNLKVYNDNGKHNEYANEQCSGSFDEAASFFLTPQRWSSLSQSNYNEEQVNLLAANFGQKVKQRQSTQEMQQIGEHEVNQSLLSTISSSAEYNRSLSANQLNLLLRQASDCSDYQLLDNVKDEKLDKRDYEYIKPLVANTDKNSINFYSTRKATSSILVDAELFSNKTAKVSKNVIPIMRSQSCSSKSSLRNDNDDREFCFYNISEKSGVVRQHGNTSIFYPLLNGENDSNANSSNFTTAFTAAPSLFKSRKSEIVTNGYYPDDGHFEFNSTVDAYVKQSIKPANDPSYFSSAFEIESHPPAVPSLLQSQKLLETASLTSSPNGGSPVLSGTPRNELQRTSLALYTESSKPESLVPPDQLPIDVLKSLRESTRGDRNFIEAVLAATQRYGSQFSSFTSFDALFPPPEELSTCEPLNKATDLANGVLPELFLKAAAFYGQSNRSFTISNVNSGKNSIISNVPRIGLNQMLASLEVLNSKPESGDNPCNNNDEDLQQPHLLKSSARGDRTREQQTSILLSTKLNEEVKSSISSIIKDVDDGTSSLRNISTKAFTTTTHTSQPSSNFSNMSDTVAAGTTETCNRQSRQRSLSNREDDNEDYGSSNKIFHFEARQSHNLLSRQVLNQQSLSQSYFDEHYNNRTSPVLQNSYCLNSVEKDLPTSSKFSEALVNYVANDERPLYQTCKSTIAENNDENFFPSPILNSPPMNSAFGLVSPPQIRNTPRAYPDRNILLLSSLPSYSEDPTPESFNRLEENQWSPVPTALERRASAPRLPTKLLDEKTNLYKTLCFDVRHANLGL